MTALPFHLLVDLASEEAQARFIENATKEEYLLPEDLLNDAWHFCEQALHPQMVDELDAGQRRAIENLRDHIANAPEDLVARADIVRDAAWIDIRERARETLSAFGEAVPN